MTCRGPSSILARANGPFKEGVLRFGAPHADPTDQLVLGSGAEFVASVEFLNCHRALRALPFFQSSCPSARIGTRSTNSDYNSNATR